MGSAISDEELIGGILDGRQEAISGLIGRYQDFAFNLSMKILRNREDAEEAVQDSFVKAIKAIRAFKRNASFKTWLYRIVYNTAVNKYRQRKSDKVTLVEDMPEDKMTSSTGIPDKYDQQVWTLKIRQAFDTLLPENRVIMSLFYLEQMSIEEIADITLLSPNLVKVRMHRSREQLRPLLSGMVDFYKSS